MNHAAIVFLAAVLLSAPAHRGDPLDRENATLMAQGATVKDRKIATPAGSRQAPRAQEPQGADQKIPGKPFAPTPDRKRNSGGPDRDLAPRTAPAPTPRWEENADPARKARATSVVITVAAIEVSNEGRSRKQVDPELGNVAGALTDLNYDTFRLVGSQSAVAGYREECELPINERYDLFVTPIEKDGTGRIRLKVRIDETARNGGAFTRRKAMDVTSVVAPGSHLKLGGLRFDGSEMVVVVSVNERR